MKQYKYILYSLAVIFGAYLFTGCTKDEMIKGEAEKPILSIVAGVSETAGTRAFDDPATDQYNVKIAFLKSMTIFLFEPKSDDNSNPLLVKTAELIRGFPALNNRISEVILTGKDLRDAEIALDAEVDIYAIANYVPADAATLTKKELMELSVPRPIYKKNGQRVTTVIPMSGVSLAFKLTSDISQKIDISLRRANIRVNLTVVDAEYQSSDYSSEITEVKLYNDYLNTYLWNEGITTSTLCRGEAAPDAKVESLLRSIENGSLIFPSPFLGNSNEKSDTNPDPENKITMKLTGSRTINSVTTPFVYTIELKRADGTFHFNRNTTLNVTLTLKAKGHSTNVEVVPWNVDTENSDINPVGIRFVDTDMPTVIPKDGKLPVTAKFNFDNPANIPFKLYMFEGDTHTGTQLNELDPDISQQKVLITALAANTTTASRKVSFWYQYNGVWVDTGVRAVQQGEEIVGITQPKANSYLVAPGSESILIPVSQVNNANAPGIAADEVLTAEMIWTDVKGASSGKGLSSDAAVAAIEVLGTGPDALLMVKPGSQLGNAVIAVKSAGVVKWSWHIWVTNYDPEQETGQNTSGGYIFMDRNLGAKIATGNATGDGVIGNYYQYGRKDPFPTKSSTTAFILTYNAEGAPVAQTSGNTASAVNQIQNPYLWGNATGYPQGSDLWGANGNKTANDPCPSGWRVPPSEAYFKLANDKFPNDVSTWGRQGAHTGYYPYTWFKDPNSTFNTGKLVVNWTSTPSGATNGIFLRADAGSTVENYSYGRSYGHAVRCVRDWNKGKFEKEIRVLSAGQFSVSHAHKLGTQAVSSHWSLGIVHLLDRNFGEGDPVDVFFKHYNYYNGGSNVDGKDYDFIDLLTTHEIDVLYLPWNGDATSPTADQSKKIVEWLDADSHRVLIVATEFKTQHDMLMAELGFTPHEYSQGGDASVLAGGTSDIYKAIANGLATKPFTNILGNGWMPRAEIEGKGYVPILTRADVSKVTMSVDIKRGVLLIGDTNWFDSGNALGGAGLLTYNDFGEYPKLFANTWALIAKKVKGL